MHKIELEPEELERIIARASQVGVEAGGKLMFERLAIYNKVEACKILKMSMPTLNKRIAERKIRSIDGRITGAEILRYLNLA